jgi:hypothetical protein
LVKDAPAWWRVWFGLVRVGVELVKDAPAWVGQVWH